jgi:hypothetical protein
MRKLLGLVVAVFFAGSCKRVGGTYEGSYGMSGSRLVGPDTVRVMQGSGSGAMVTVTPAGKDVSIQALGCTFVGKASGGATYTITSQTCAIDTKVGSGAGWSTANDIGTVTLPLSGRLVPDGDHVTLTLSGQSDDAQKSTSLSVTYNGNRKN